jgi:hypothetical protein
MKIIDITSKKLKPMSDDEVEKIHLRIHQVYRNIIQRRSLLIEFGDLIREKHMTIVRELKIREIEHKTPIR